MVCAGRQQAPGYGGEPTCRHAGEAALIQRFQFHNRRNVLDHMPEEHCQAVKRKLQDAYVKVVLLESSTSCLPVVNYQLLCQEVDKRGTMKIHAIRTVTLGIVLLSAVSVAVADVANRQAKHLTL